MLNLWPYRDDTPGVRHSFVDVTTGRGLIGVRFPGIFRGQNGFVQVFVRLAMVERVEVIVSCQQQSARVHTWWIESGHGLSFRNKCGCKSCRNEMARLNTSIMATWREGCEGGEMCAKFNAGYICRCTCPGSDTTKEWQHFLELNTNGSRYCDADKDSLSWVSGNTFFMFKICGSYCPETQARDSHLIRSHHSFPKAFVVFLFRNLAGGFTFLVKEVRTKPFRTAQTKCKQIAQWCSNVEKQRHTTWHIEIANAYTIPHNMTTCLGKLREFCVSRVAVRAHMENSHGHANVSRL